MSFLSDKYGVPQETIKKMMKSGVISCSWEGYEEVLKLRDQGKSIRDIAIDTGRSTSSVFSILRLCKKM